MEVKILSEKENQLLKRREVSFQVEHNQTGSTPPRLEVRNAIAAALGKDVNLVFVKRICTKTGTHIAVGEANVYDSQEQSNIVEPSYVIKRNLSPEKPEEKVEEKEEK